MPIQKFELYIKYDTETGVVQVIQTDDRGRTIDPISLQVNNEFVMAFSELFSASQQQTIVALTSENAGLIADKTSLQLQVDTLMATVENLTAQVTSLLPWNPRWIDPEKFVARFTSVQTRRVYDINSTDETLIGARQLLDAYIDANYYIDLDDPQVTDLTAYMVSLNPPILTAEERTNVLRDSSSSERYMPTPT